MISGNTVYETVKPGGIVDELAIVDQGSSRSASVITVTCTKLTRIDIAAFLTLIERAPDFV